MRPTTNSSLTAQYQQNQPWVQKGTSYQLTMLSLRHVALGRERLAITPALILGVLVSILFPIASPASVNTIRFTNSPALYPAFDSAVRDYVIRLTSTTQVVQVTITNSDPTDTTTTVSVDGQAPTAGAFTTSLTLTEGQGF